MAYTFAKKVVGFDYRGIAFSQYSAEASALFAVMTTPPTGGRATAYDDYIKALINNYSLWSTMGCLFILCSENADDSLINVIYPGDNTKWAEWVGTPGANWVSNSGHKIHGSTDYARTKWIANTMPGWDNQFMALFAAETGSVSSQQDWAISTAHQNGQVGIRLGDATGVATGAISQGNIGNQSSSVVSVNASVTAVIDNAPGTFTFFSIDGGAYQQVGATPKTRQTGDEGTEKLDLVYSFQANDNGARVQIVGILKTYDTVNPNPQIATFNTLTKTFLNTLSVTGY